VRGGGAGHGPHPGQQGTLDNIMVIGQWGAAPRHGATGPPRDLAFRQCPTNGHGTMGQLTVATTNQDRMMAGMPTRGVTQDMSQHGAGPTLEVHFQAWDTSAPQYQGTQMQLEAMLPGQPGIAQASQHQGFARTVGFVTQGQVLDAQAHQAQGTGGLPGAGAPGLAGGAQTPQHQGMQRK
jgi:hypothetical protein